MKAKLENDTINVYDEKGVLISGIKTQPNSKASEISIRERTLDLTRNNWDTKIVEDGKEIYNLKTHSFSGNTNILETGHKITGVFGFMWGTKMIDEEGNTLVKIPNKNQFINKNKYDIEVSSDKVSDLDILLTLYGHVQGSRMKLLVVLMGVIVGIVITKGILSS